MKIQVKPFEFTNENYHLGHLIVDTLRNRPHAICQIDAATGESETNASVLSRSIQFARCLRRFGVKPGDVLALGGDNHLDLVIPFYAALMIGMPVAGVDPYYKHDELKRFFSVSEPKIAFCQKHLVREYLNVIKELELDTHVISFDDAEYSMKKFITEYDDQTINVEEFEPAMFDLEKIYSCLQTTSGTTGNFKMAASKHRQWVTKLFELRDLYFNVITNGKKIENNLFLYTSPVQWVSWFRNQLVISLMKMTKLQSSGPRNSAEHLPHIINKYRPVAMHTQPMYLTSIIEDEMACDLKCFNCIFTGGAKLIHNTYNELRKKMRRDSHVVETYGSTEFLGDLFKPALNRPYLCLGNGKFAFNQLKLVDIKTGEEITKPNIPGELLTKGPRFSEYYKDPKLTASVITEDGWFKTGDVLYRDEHDNYYFVDRVKHMVEGKASGPVIEEVIRSHPGVRDVCVVAERPAHIVACVVRRPGISVTEQEIKDLVTRKLPESQRLQGGVIFMEQFPYTSTGKVARANLIYFVYSTTWE